MSEPVASLLQTLAWIGLICAVLVVYRHRLGAVLDAIVGRVREGAELQIGAVKLRGAPPGIRTGKEELATAEGVAGSRTPDEVEGRLESRAYSDGVVEELFLVHSASVIRPPARLGPGRRPILASAGCHGRAS